jgi:hypothetical protein
VTDATQYNDLGNIAEVSGIIAAIVSGVNELRRRNGDAALMTGPSSPSSYRTWLAGMPAVLSELALAGYTDDALVAVSNTTNLKQTSASLATIPGSTVNKELYKGFSSSSSSFRAFFEMAGDALINSLRQQNALAAIVSDTPVSYVTVVASGAGLTSFSDRINLEALGAAPFNDTIEVNLVEGRPYLLRAGWNMLAGLNPVITMGGTPLAMTANVSLGFDSAVSETVINGTIITFSMQTVGIPAAGNNMYVIITPVMLPVRRYRGSGVDIVESLEGAQRLPTLHAQPWASAVCMMLSTCNVWCSAGGTNYATKFAGWVPTTDGLGIDFEATWTVLPNSTAGKTQLRDGLRYLAEDWPLLKGLYLTWLSRQA